MSGQRAARRLPACPAGVLDRVAAIVAASPRAPALFSDGSRLDYAGLWQRAGLLAGRLARLGLGPDDRVAVAASRDIAAIAGILGVLRAGCAFVPFDHASPAELTAEMFAVAGVRAVVTSQATAVSAALPGLPWVPAAPPAPGERPAGISRPSGLSAPSPQALAYVIFTSGTTGRPKAVGVDHRALACLTSWSREVFEVVSSDVFLQFARLTFDASIWEIFTPLTAGAALAIVPAETAASPAGLELLLREHGVTHADLPPAVWDTLRLDEMPRLRVCMTGGEAVAARTVRHCAAPGRTVVNGYGPTEVTDLSVIGACDPDCAWPPPIGTPAEGTTAYIVTDELAIAAAGEPGELYLGGAQLARGYLGEPGLTASRFVPDPWGGDEGSRLYRTGDLGRRRADGVIEYIGRRDRQVKVRGMRVELGDCESHLNAYAGVREAAVTAMSSAAGTRLLGHVAGDTDPGSLRRELAARAPAQLIPAAYAWYQLLPRTPIGKIDYAKLRTAPDAASAAGQRLEPRLAGSADVINAELALAVHEVLGIEPAGWQLLIDLGADSLDAMRIIARLREANLDLSARELLTTRLAELRPAPAITSAPMLRPAPTAEVASGTGRAGDEAAANLTPLTPVQAGIWFEQLLRPGGTAFLIPVSLELDGPLDLGRLRLAWSAVVSRHDALRSRIELVRGRPYLAPAAQPPALTWHDLTTVAEPELEAAASQLLARSASEPFALTQGPPFRLTVLRMSASRHVLGLTAHHILCDGWSLAVLIGDLGAAYDKLAAGGPAADPGSPAVPSAAFAAYARDQADKQATGKYDDGARFWNELLTEPPAAWPARTDGSVPAGTAIGRVFDIGDELTHRLRSRSLELRVTLFVVLLAGFAGAIAAIGRLDRVVIGVVSANRPYRELEEVVGNFVNTLPLPIAVPSGQQTGPRLDVDLIGSVDKLVSVSSPHWEVPLPLITAARTTGRQLSGGPWNAVFEFDSMPPARFDSAGVTGKLSDDGLQQGAIGALCLRVVDRGSMLRCILVGDASVFSAPSLAGIERAVLRAWQVAI
ncbi:MAG TPA: amino acid adenylation domain-containing protein [Streptosporangiaceae bacterium]|nr:amino acid adenylation domain-containing protein [Streptosporangiaceae bacterium]